MGWRTIEAFDIVGERDNGVAGVQSQSKHPDFIFRICRAVNTPPIAVTAEITMAETDSGSDIIIYFLLFFGDIATSIPFILS